MATTGASLSQPLPTESDDMAGSSIETALARLNQALDGLEQAVDTSVTSRSKAVNADEQVQRMTDDRAKLARDLDEAEARAAALKDVNSEVSRRLVGAMEMVRSVLEKQD